MAEGYIRISILKLLLEGEKTGYSLMSELNKELGKKPSSGTIYPMLKKLNDEGLVKYKSNGQKKEYSLTIKGKNSIKNIIVEKEDLLLKQINLVNLISKMHDEKCIKLSKNICDNLYNNSSLIAKHLKDWIELKKIAIEIISSPDYVKKKKKINKAIKNMVTELKKIKEEI